MTGEGAQAPRAAARRPAGRTITETIAEGDFAGWSATARADFPARLVVELDSGKLERILGALEVIIVEHNMPNSDGEVAATLGDVDPYAGLLAMSNAIGEALRRLPPR